MHICFTGLGGGYGKLALDIFLLADNQNLHLRITALEAVVRVQRHVPGAAPGGRADGVGVIDGMVIKPPPPARNFRR